MSAAPGFPQRRAANALLALLLALAFATTAGAAPTKNSHDLTWYVHDSMVDSPGGTNDLAYWQALIAARLAEGNLLVEGSHGPSDTPCCVTLDAVTVTTFSGAGLDWIENEDERDAILDGPDGGYLVEAVWYCGSFSTTIRGCAYTPGNNFIVSIESDASNRLPAVIAHERGHNAGLPHASGSACNLMDGTAGGGCLSVSECQAFITKADSTGGSCACLADTVGDPQLADGSVCTDSFGSGLCSGAVCGESGGPADTRLLLAAGAGSASGETTDDAVGQSPLTGGWETLGAIGTGIAPTGLAYDASRDVVFAIAPQTVGNDRLHTLDPSTGALLSTVGTLPYTEVSALAYDPTGDRLFAIQRDAVIFGSPYSCSSGNTCISMLFEIDPDDASTAVYGELNTLIISDGVQGLAWDSNAGILYGSTAVGLHSLGLNCSGGACSNTTTVDNNFRRPSALAYDALTDTLYRQGAEFGRSEFDVLDPATASSEMLAVIEEQTVGGMAVVPMPEPSHWIQLGSGLALLTVLGRRRNPGRADPVAASLETD
jgi:hypothetical protein